MPFNPSCFTLCHINSGASGGSVAASLRAQQGKGGEIWPITLQQTPDHTKSAVGSLMGMQSWQFLRSHLKDPHRVKCIDLLGKNEELSQPVISGILCISNRPLSSQCLSADQQIQAVAKVNFALQFCNKVFIYTPAPGAYLSLFPIPLISHSSICSFLN